MNKFFVFGLLIVGGVLTGNTAHANIAALAADVKMGAEGEKVTILQDFLRAEGHFTRESTGYFGPVTEAALRQYQTSNGLVATGIIDLPTIAMLQTDYTSGELAARSAIARNPEMVAPSLNLLSQYVENLDVEAEETAITVSQLERLVTALERILR